MTSQNQTFLSETDKLNILNEILQDITPKYPLKVVYNDDPISFAAYQQQSRNNTYRSQSQNVVYTYELIGSRSMRKTQNNNLVQKIQQLTKIVQQKEAKQVQKRLNMEKNGNEGDLDQNKQQQKQQNEGEHFRYFSQNIRCFRCKKLGHFNYTCLNQFSCNLCLSSEHHSDKCPQKTVCYRCYNFGHVLNQCPQKQDGPYCQNCKKKHLDKCGFLMKGIEQVKQMFSMDHLYNHQDMRCLKCFQYGHQNCVVSYHQPTDYKRSYYEQENYDRRNNNQRGYGYKKSKY